MKRKIKRRAVAYINFVSNIKDTHHYQQYKENAFLMHIIRPERKLFGFYYSSGDFAIYKRDDISSLYSHLDYGD